MTEKYFPLKDIATEARATHNLFASLQFPANALIRAGDLQLQVMSVNDSKDTVTLKLIGVFLKPRTDEDDASVDVIEPKPEPIILTPNRRIVKP
jgi:hypothetical protein